MQLILTHENADFDAVASLLAAKRLFPEAVPLLPRRINRNVEQFLTLYWSVLPFVRAEDWRKRRVDSLLLVDTHSPLSVRGVRRHPEVRVIDHHLDFTPQQNWHYQVEAVGATTTLLVEKLQAAGLSLAAEEAILLLLGIYEDTGALTYDTTTVRDVRAAAWLIEQGALLHVVRRFLNIPLTEEQQALYDRLLTAAEWVHVAGRQVLVTTAEAPAGFEDEISSVVHRLRDALVPPGLFVLVQLGQDVQLVARSSEANVDVAVVARALGGGGHSRAAAALVTGSSTEAVRRRLEQVLPEAVQPQHEVREIMSFGVQTVAADLAIGEAAALMHRLGYEGYPVVDAASGTLVGLLTRRAVDRALTHDLARFPVSRIMKAGRVTVQPSDSIERVQQLMLTEGWGQIPVVAAGAAAPERAAQLLGIVTRTDLLNFLFRLPDQESGADLRPRLQQGLSPAMWCMVLQAGAEADRLGMPLYFVGGLVRDLLLDLPPQDLDMVVEGDAIALVRRLQTRFGGEVHSHRRFGTAKWFTSPPVWRQVLATAESGAPPRATAELPPSIDFVTARTEFYREPSALPEVERGSIKLDLHRRDFSINTLAVRLDGAHLGELLDFYGGQRDLEQGVIRVLHSLSFVDDPTRMLRAVRLEQRLGFTIEARTAELLADALPMLDRVTGDRIRHEIELALREDNPAEIMARLAQVGILAQLHPGLAWPPDTAAAFARVPPLLADNAWRRALRGGSPAFVYFALWVLSLPAKVGESLMTRLRVRKRTRTDVAAARQLVAAARCLNPRATPSQVVQIMRSFQPRVLLVGRAALGQEAAATLVETYYRQWRQVRTELDGHDLRQLGLKPGPRFGILLDQLLAARLDGKVGSRAEEMALLQELLAATEAES